MKLERFKYQIHAMMVWIICYIQCRTFQTNKAIQIQMLQSVKTLNRSIRTFLIIVMEFAMCARWNILSSLHNINISKVCFEFFVIFHFVQPIKLGSDKTIFTYSLRTLKPANLPRDFCSYYPWEQPVPLKEFHISVPCECKHLIQNGNALIFATDGMMPQNEQNGISEYFWHFTNLNVKVGQEQNVTIVMNGMIPFGMGDYTLIGDMDRCGYGRHVIRVPDVCNNRCLWGQWTQWDTQWTSCSKKCGGGITKRTRKCVSVCDGKTPVFNCYGEAEEITPCNTQKCGGYTMANQYVSSARYWSAG